MKDSDRLELDWLLKGKLEELIASVRPMSAKNCEQIVRAILDRIGGPSFEQLLMRIVETMVPRDGRGPPTNSDEYYFAIRDLFPHVPRKMMSWADSWAPRKISAYGMMIGVHGRGTARLFDPRPQIEAV